MKLAYKILLILEASKLSEQIVFLLEQVGFRPDHAKNANDAWIAARALAEGGQQYDLVIIPQSWGGGEGFQLAVDFKEIWHPADILMISDEILVPFHLKISAAEVITPVLVERVAEILTEQTPAA